MKRLKIYSILVLALLAAIFFLPADRKETSKNLSDRNNQLRRPEVEARAALAEDLLTGEVLFSKNSGEILPLASITKIVALLAALDYAGLDEEAGPPRLGEDRKHFLVKDLVSMAMAESSNDAVTALFEYAAEKNQIVQEKQKEWFLDLMRKKAERLGAANMQFYNIWGLDESLDLAGGYGSADDLLKIAKASLGSPLWQLGAVSEVVSKEGIKHNLKSTNELGPELTPLVGSKTGYTDLAGGNLLVIVEYPIGSPLGIVVLGSTEKGRFEDVKKILEWVKAEKLLIK